MTRTKKAPFVANIPAAWQHANAVRREMDELMQDLLLGNISFEEYEERAEEQLRRPLNFIRGYTNDYTDQEWNEGRK